jgi:hypothetical protein
VRNCTKMGTEILYMETVMAGILGLRSDRVMNSA